MTDKLHIVEQDEDGMLYEVTKVYTVTISRSDDIEYVVYTFTQPEDKQEFLDYLDTLTIKDNFEIKTEEYTLNSVEDAKKEAFEFINR